MKSSWEERFESSYGRWRGYLDPLVYAYLDCGDLERGFARVVCDGCKNEFLVAFSCSRRSLCPSCDAKRGAILGAFLREEVAVEVGHCLWTFTLPKLLRPYFRHHRKLLGGLLRASFETVADLVHEALSTEDSMSSSMRVRPGMVAALHTAASDLRWHPHVHAITTRGGFDQDGTWHPVPYVDEKAAELLFRQKVIRLLDDQGLLSQERLEILDAWKAGHTGFSAHNRVTVSAQDKDGLERLARYLVRSPVSLERLELDGALVRYRHKRAHPAMGEAFDAHDFLARVLMHVPAPRLHTVRYYGHYASAARGRRRKLADQPDSRDRELSEEDAIGSDDKHRRRSLRRQWAQLIRRIYEADPLLCNCGETMRIVSFVLEGSAIRKILQHLEQREKPARAPPQVTAPLEHQPTAPTA